MLSMIVENHSYLGSVKFSVLGSFRDWLLKCGNFFFPSFSRFPDGCC